MSLNPWGALTREEQEWMSAMSDFSGISGVEELYGKEEVPCDGFLSGGLLDNSSSSSSASSSSSSSLSASSNASASLSARFDVPFDDHSQSLLEACPMEDEQDDEPIRALEEKLDELGMKLDKMLPLLEEENVSDAIFRMIEVLQRRISLMDELLKLKRQKFDRRRKKAERVKKEEEAAMTKILKKVEGLPSLKSEVSMPVFNVLMFWDHWVRRELAKY